MGTRNHCLGPRQIARFEQAASLLPGVDPVEPVADELLHITAILALAAMSDCSLAMNSPSKAVCVDRRVEVLDIGFDDMCEAVCHRGQGIGGHRVLDIRISL